MLCELEKRFDEETIADLKKSHRGVPAPNMPRKEKYLMYPVPQLEVGKRVGIKRKRGYRPEPLASRTGVRAFGAPQAVGQQDV